MTDFAAGPQSRTASLEAGPDPAYSHVRRSATERPARQFLDAHVHLWDRDRLEYRWLADVDGLERRYGPDELAYATAQVPLGGAIVVQADCAPLQAGAEVRWLGELAAAGAPIRGIVAYAPLEDLADSIMLLDRYADQPLVCGIRRNIQGNASGFAARLVPGVREVARRNLPFDLCVTADQLPEALDLVHRIPEATFILDHLGKPRPGGAGIERWRSDLAAMADAGKVYCKLSGLATECGPDATFEDMRVLLEHAMEVFGPERVMFGSDWPVSTSAIDYETWFDLVSDVVAEHDADAVFGQTAARVYRTTTADQAAPS